MCALFWQADPSVSRRTQSSLAVSGNGADWIILNCSPDIREQIDATAKLRPNGAPRGSPIRTVVLTSGDVDHIGGLLTLREQGRFDLYAPAPVLDVLRGNNVFSVLDPACVTRYSLQQGEAQELPGKLRLESFAVPGKLPLYLEKAPMAAHKKDEFTIGLRLSDANGRSLAYVPACAGTDQGLHEAIAPVDALFFDGTLWTDNELIEAGVGDKTGRRMGHMPISGADGSLAAFKDVNCRAKFYIHINNTNPLNCATSPERRQVEAEGWRVPSDGTEISL
jgi:pyrroloquinoline quinone biosynthesis protein B